MSAPGLGWYYEDGPDSYDPAIVAESRAIVARLAQDFAEIASVSKIEHLVIKRVFENGGFEKTGGINYLRGLDAFRAALHGQHDALRDPLAMRAGGFEAFLNHYDCIRVLQPAAERITPLILPEPIKPIKPTIAPLDLDDLPMLKKSIDRSIIAQRTAKMRAERYWDSDEGKTRERSLRATLAWANARAAGRASPQADDYSRAKDLIRDIKGSHSTSPREHDKIIRRSLSQDMQRGGERAAMVAGLKAIWSRRQLKPDIKVKPETHVKLGRARQDRTAGQRQDDETPKPSGPKRRR